MVDDDVEKDTALALIVNVRKRWRDVLRGNCTDAEAVLGDWNLADRDLDPQRVRAVLGSAQRRIVRAWRVHNPQLAPGYERQRVRFTPQARLHHLEGMASPYVWQRGEMYPVVAVPLDQLDFDLEPLTGVDLGATGEVSIGGYTLRVAADGATVLVPAGQEVRVKTVQVVDPGTASKRRSWPAGPDGHDHIADA